MHTTSNTSYLEISYIFAIFCAPPVLPSSRSILRPNKFPQKSKRKCVAQIWDSAFGWFWQKSCGKVSRWLVGRVTEPPFLLCLPLLTIIFLIIFRLIYNMLSCLVNCNPYFIFLSQRLSFSFSSVLFLHIILSNKL